MHAETVKAEATITAIDKATRDATHKGPQDGEFTFKAGSEVKNLDQLKVGDQVEATDAEAIAIAVTPAARK
jgi:hypothetical protein